MDGLVKKEKIIAIIPARGGSKRIPKKNILDFYGKPLIAWTIEAAKKSLEGATAAGNNDYIKMNNDSIKEWSSK